MHGVPITELKPDVDVGNEGTDGGAGLGVVLHGSRPSSYTELMRGLSVTKLEPNCDDVP